MKFSDIPGFMDLKQKLIDMDKAERVPHAQLFVGPKGSASLAIAFSFIKFSQCLNKKKLGDSCDYCHSCKKINNFNFPDIYYSFPLAKNAKFKNSISLNYIKKWREFLVNNSYSSVKDWSEYLGEQKILNIYKEESKEIIKFTNLNSLTSKRYVLMWLPEYMHISTANALLKTLEEPLENIYFILVSNDYEKIPITITSRMQAHYLRKFYHNEISEYLVKKYKLAIEDAKKIAQLSDGDMSEALKIYNKNNIEYNFEHYKEWLRACYSKKYNKLITLMESFGNLNKEEQKQFCEYSINMMRNILLIIFEIQNNFHISAQEIEFLKKVSQYFSVFKITNITNNLEYMIRNIENNANVKINFLDMSIKFSNIFGNDVVKK